MPFVTYENYRNAHVTIHVVGCSQVAKHGGQHRFSQGVYKHHTLYDLARDYAQGTGLPIIDCSFCNPAAPPAIRILPLNRQKEFQDCETAKDVQQKYFLRRLPAKQHGWFYYREKGLRARPGTVVLFQCDTSIIASAIFHHGEKFDKPDDKDFKGKLYFDVDSIKIFHPVIAEGVKKAWPSFKTFGNVKQHLDPKGYPAFECELKGIEKPVIWLGSEQADQGESDGLEGYNPQGVDSRRLVKRQIRQRRGQGPFRDALRKRYGNRCLVTGCQVLAVLEAAHICPYRGEPDNHPDNGLLLRTDIHTLFDLDLLGIEPNQLRVQLHPDITKEYGNLAGTALGCPDAHRPSLNALKQRFELFQHRLHEPA